MQQCCGLVFLNVLFQDSFLVFKMKIVIALSSNLKLYDGI